MINRLPELITQEDTESPLQENDVKITIEGKFGDFSQLKQKFHAHIDEIKKNHELIQTYHEQHQQNTHNPEKEKSLRTQIQKKFDEVLEIQTQAKLILDQMVADIKKSENKEDAQKKQVILKSLAGNLKDSVEESQKLEEICKNYLKDMWKNKLTIVGAKDLTKEQIEKYCENPEEGEQYLVQKIQGRSFQLINQVNDLKDKLKDIQTLNSMTKKLHNLFVYCAVLVQQHTEILIQVDQNVAQAAEDIKKGADELTKANQYQKDARKRKCCILICVLILLAVVLAPILGGTLGSA